MKLLRLKINNIMRLEALEVAFHPKGAVTLFSGKNDIGKSTALNAIAMALGGKKLCPDEPLRYGQTAGFVELDLGEFHPEGPLAELKVKRVFGKGEKLIVTDANGFKSASPQAVLDKLCAGIAFDPRAFAVAEPKAQIQTLKELAGLDFSALDAEAAQIFDERTLVNREIKQLESRLAGMTVDPSAPDEEIAASNVMAELDAAKERNEEINASERALASLRGNIVALESEREELLARVEAIGEEIEGNSLGIQMHEMVLQNLSPVDLAPIKTKIQNLDAQNAAARTKKQRNELASALADLQKQANEYTASLAAISAEKALAIENATFPVAGLAFDDAGVRYKGTLIGQLAFSESLRISTAIGLAMMPDLPLVLIDQGSELDDEHLRLVAQLAAEHGAQVVGTLVSSSEQIEVQILDGEGHAVARE